MFKIGRLCGAFLVALTVNSHAVAQTEPVVRPASEVTNIREAITQGVMISPRVNADYFNFAALGEAERGAFAGYLPSADIYAELGREDRETPFVDFDDYGRDLQHFSITQMLFDGFATRNEVSRLGYEKLAQYYTFKRASEEVALEVAVAYLETVQFQQLVKYAADNLEVHRQIHDQISERTGGGASAGVDLDQSTSRLGLAEQNLVTEVANLNDVNIRFERLVGVGAKGELDIPDMPDADIPEARGAALDIAYQTSPVINAAIENLRASQEALEATNAPMMPRLDLRYRREWENDTDGIQGDFDEEAVELVLSYNLFRGGADAARKREFYNLYYAAIEERKQACLNVRQLISNDFNDLANLRQQVVLTEISLQAQDKTRVAYRDQFARGQRTLLDLLDAQNEFFDSQRAHISAQTDLLAAEASTLANMGMLLASLEVGGLNAERIAAMELDLSRDPSDENTHALCPPEPDTLVDASDLLYTTHTFSASTLFDFDQAELKEDGMSELSRLGDEIESQGASVQDIDVIGHTDSVGSESYNQFLSERRARAVADFLVNMGVDPGRIDVIGKGESEPVASNETEEGRAQNRRVEVSIGTTQ